MFVKKPAGAFLKKYTDLSRIGFQTGSKSRQCWECVQHDIMLTITDCSTDYIRFVYAIPRGLNFAYRPHPKENAPEFDRDYDMWEKNMDSLSSENLVHHQFKRASGQSIVIRLKADTSPAEGVASLRTEGIIFTGRPSKSDSSLTELLVAVSSCWEVLPLEESMLVHSTRKPLKEYNKDSEKVKKESKRHYKENDDFLKPEWVTLKNRVLTNYHDVTNLENPKQTLKALNADIDLINIQKASSKDLLFQSSIYDVLSFANGKKGYIISEYKLSAHIKNTGSQRNPPSIKPDIKWPAITCCSTPMKVTTSNNQKISRFECSKCNSYVTAASNIEAIYRFTSPKSSYDPISKQTNLDNVAEAWGKGIHDKWSGMFSNLARIILETR